MFACLFAGCKADEKIESKVRFSSNQSGILKDNCEISGEDAANIIKSYSKSELMLSENTDYSLFISSDTAAYDNAVYYEVVAGTVRKNNFDYYDIEEIRCYLVSLDGEKSFIYDKENGSLIPLNIIRDIVA